MTIFPAQPFDRQRVATLYVAALELEIPIISTLVDVLKVTNSRARYMTRVARDEGFLGRAPHHPTRAVIHRNTYKEKSWLVCQECLTRWPCPPAFPNKQKADRPTQ